MGHLYNKGNCSPIQNVWFLPCTLCVDTAFQKEGAIAEFRVSNSLCGQSRQRSKSVPKESAIHIHYTDISSSKLAALRNIFRNFFLRMDFILKQVVIYGGQLEKNTGLMFWKSILSTKAVVQKKNCNFIRNK